MRRSRLILLLLTGLLILQACASTPTTDPRKGGESPPEPPAPQPSAKAPEPQPPGPEQSPVTWRVTHTGTGLNAPGGPVHLAPPYRFEINFSAPVDRTSVEEALRQNLGHGRVQILQWSNDRRLWLTVEDLTAAVEQSQVAVDPTGGRDLNGKRLQVELSDFVLASFLFWPAPSTNVVTLDPMTGQTTILARHPQPFQSVSLSPDGSRMLLRRHILTLGQSVGTTGTAYLFDLKTGYLEDLEVGGLFKYEWSNDGALLVYGACRQGATCVVWVGPGPHAGSARGGLRRLLYTNGPGEYVASTHLSPDGQYAAAFAGKWDQALDLHLFALHPDRTGRKIRTVGLAAGVTQGPSGLTWVPVAWSPDGRTLAYGDGGTRREESQPMKIWLVDPTAGRPRKLADEAGDPGPWSPDSTRLFVRGVGVLDREGQLLLEAREGSAAAWSSDGTRLYWNGAVYETNSWTQLWRTEATGDARWSPSGEVIAIAGWGGDPRPGLGPVEGGLFRADGTLIARSLYDSHRVRFSPDGRLAYLPNPDRIVEIATGAVRPIGIDLPAIQGLGEYRPVAFTAEGHLLLSLGLEWER